MSSDKVIVGKFGKTFGLSGSLKINSFTVPKANILNFSSLYIYQNNQWSKLEIENLFENGREIIGKLKHCNSPESAKIFTNLYIYVPRDDFPKLNNNEYYWADLENLKVINMENIELGIVTGLMSTGANDVLIVKNDNKETLIPYTKQVIVKVDLKQKTIKVNWDEIL